jgi:hypothetical protein
MTWNGEWKPTIPFSPIRMSRLNMAGIAPLAIDGREIKCEILTDAPRGQTFARSLESGRFYQLVKS